MENYLHKLIQKVKALMHVGAGDVFYIASGGEILPDKLTSEEEYFLAEKLSLGDEQARMELIERNLRLVVYTASKFENTKINMEDLIQVGTIGLIKAVSSFNLDKNIKMATYASRCIENEILMFLRKTSKEKKEISLDEPLSSDKDGNELSVADVIGTDADAISKGVEDSDEKSVLNLALAELPEREKLIMDMRFGLNGKTPMTQKEVADFLNISQSYISRLEKRIVVKLKKFIRSYY